MYCFVCVSAQERENTQLKKQLASVSERISVLDRMQREVSASVGVRIDCCFL